jgi:hypothetical protein
MIGMHICSHKVHTNGTLTTDVNLANSLINGHDLLSTGKSIKIVLFPLQRAAELNCFHCFTKR